MNSKSDPKRGNMTKKFTAAALTVALILMLTLACSGDESAAAPEADQTQQERMGEEMDSLKQEMEESKETRGADEASVQEDETALTPATTSLPDSTPELAVIPTPSGPGICGRSPAVQKAILKDLKVSLCRAVTEGELFRITALGVDMNTARAGDFQGLVNVEELSIGATNVDPQSFTGMQSLKKLRLTIEDEGSIAPHAFQNLQRLEEMTLTVAPNGSIETGAFQGLSNLKHINIQWYETGILPSTPFDNLPNLESAEISIKFRDDDEKRGFRIASKMFENNPNLKKIQLDISAPDRARVNFPEELFSNNPLLEEIRIYFQSARWPKNTFEHLENLKELDLHEYLNEDDQWEYHKLALHESSPLYSVLTLTGKQPMGFKLVENE